MHVKITVKTNTREEKIQKIGENAFLVMLKESPKHERANARLLNLLSRFFQKNARIVHGMTSRHKIIELS
jgi:uncharacterized protein YggU (UPF0235/DUF167 family)